MYNQEGATKIKEAIDLLSAALGESARDNSTQRGESSSNSSSHSSSSQSLTSSSSSGQSVPAVTVVNCSNQSQAVTACSNAINALAHIYGRYELLNKKETLSRTVVDPWEVEVRDKQKSQLQRLVKCPKAIGAINLCVWDPRRQTKRHPPLKRPYYLQLVLARKS